jgi:hypothetical protein
MLNKEVSKMIEVGEVLEVLDNRRARVLMQRNAA